MGVLLKIKLESEFQVLVGLKIEIFMEGSKIFFISLAAFPCAFG